MCDCSECDGLSLNTSTITTNIVGAGSTVVSGTFPNYTVTTPTLVSSFTNDAGYITSALTTLPLGVQNIFVSKTGNDGIGTNSDLAKSFLTIGAAITKASSLTPSSSNIINLIIYGGTYAENITIPQYVNLYSIYPNELIYNNISYSTIATTSANALRPVYINGTITVNSDNVKIVGVNCNTLSINTTGSNCSFKSIVASTSITTNTNISTNFYDVHSLLFLSTTNSVGGYFEKCTFGDYSIASGNLTVGGTTSATLKDCIGTNYCISSSLATTAGNFTGKLINFIGTLGCVSSSLTGVGGTISGEIDNFSTTSGSSLGFGTTGGTFSGTLKNTTISEALGLSKVTLTGYLIRCRIRATQAGANGVTVGANSKIRYCDIKNGSGGFSVAAPASVNIAMVHSNLYGGGLNNVTNLVTTSYCTDDVNDLF